MKEKNPENPENPDLNSIWPKEEKKTDPSALAEFTAQLVDELKHHNDLKDRKEVRDAEALIDAVTPAAYHGFPDMPAECCVGYLGDLTQERGMQAFPRCFSYLALCVMGAAKMIVQPERPLRSNFYLGLVGPVGCGKSQVLERAAEMLHVQEPELIQLHAGSFEQLVKHVGNPHGECRVWLVDELIYLGDKSNIDRATFPAALSTLFYKPFYEVSLGRKDKDKTRFAARLSVAGGIVEERFGEVFGYRSAGGMYDRFAFGLYPGGWHYHYQAMPAEKTEPLEPIFTKVLDQEINEAFKAYRETHPDMNPRVLEIAMRMQLIAFGYCGYKVFKARDLDCVFRLAEYQMLLRQYLMPESGLTLDARCGNAIVKYLSRSRKWLGWREVKRSTHILETYGAPLVERVLIALISSSQIAQTKIGKKVMMRYVFDDEEEAPEKAEE